MLQNLCQTMGFKKNMAYKIPLGGGGGKHSTPLDPISMGCGIEPHLRHCVVFLNMTLYHLLSTGFPPMKSGDIVLALGVYAPFCLSVCLSTCSSRNIPKYLLVRFDAFSV